MRLAVYLAFKEVLRNKLRFFLFSLVIALITTLVLFIAALAEGLAQANKQLLEKVDAELLVFQKDVDLMATTSRISLSKLNDIERVEGVQSAGAVGFASGTLVFGDGRDDLDVALVGIEAGKPAAPPVISGSAFIIDRGLQAIVDRSISSRSGAGVGDRITVKTIQGTREQLYQLEIVGITDERQYMYQPAVFLPYRTWEQIRPGASSGPQLVETISNMVAVKVQPGLDPLVVAGRIEQQVTDVETSDIKTAYEALPGYSAQQSTLDTQSGFTLLIGILVIGGFFQIQMLQKIPLIGVLKAIGTSNPTVALAVVAQVILVTAIGVMIGALAAFGLGAAIPEGVPAVFNVQSMLVSILTLLAIGPIGGLVSVRLAIGVEPLIALGLSN